MRGARALALIVVCLTASNCAARLSTLPGGPGRPFPEFAAAYAGVSASCREMKTMRAVLGLSGRAGGSRIRGDVDAGFEAPDRVRLEMPAPGRAYFQLVARGDEATLLLPRQEQVLVKAPSAETLEAIAGVALGPRELTAIVSGCGFDRGEAAVNGQRFDERWASGVVGGSTVWLEQVDGAWRLTAARRDAIEVRYGNFAAGRAESIRVRAETPTGATDLTLRLSQVDRNETLHPATFEIAIPEGTTPITLEQLRHAGLFGR